MIKLSSPVRIALAGLGDVSLLHKRAIEMCREARLVGAWTRNQEKLAKLTVEWQIHAYSTYDELLADDTINVVDITAADELHYDFTLRALAAGKHVLVEKPPAESSQQVRAINQAAMLAGLHCIPMHNYIYRPGAIQAKRLVDEGRMGTVTFGFFSEVMNMPEESATHYHGVLVTAMYHMIYGSLFFLGKPDRVFAQQESLHYKKCQDDDLTSVLLHYANGAMVFLLGNWAADDLASNSWYSLWKWIGTEGVVNISDQDALVYSAMVSSAGGAGWGKFQWPNYEDSFLHAIDYIVKRCLLEGERPLSGLDDAITTMEIIELAKQSARENRALKIS
jgi:predicted dehydrogenase